MFAYVNINSCPVIAIEKSFIDYFCVNFCIGHFWERDEFMSELQAACEWGAIERKKKDHIQFFRIPTNYKILKSIEMNSDHVSST